MNSLKLLTAAAVLSVPTTLMAQSMGSSDGAHAYVGANYGYLKVKSDDDFDDDNDAFQGLVGFQFNPFIAVEGSYIDFGEYGSNAVNASTDGMTLALKGILPITDFVSLYIKGGQLWWESDYQVLGVNGDVDGDEMFYGAGVGLSLTESFMINFEYNRYEVELESDEVGVLAGFTDDQDLDHVTVGVSYHF